MLTCDILTLFTNNPTYDFGDGSFIINRLICEGFSYDMSKNEMRVLRLYTKVNKKPTERCIKLVSDKISIVFQKLHNKLDAIFKDNAKIFNLLQHSITDTQLQLRRRMIIWKKIWFRRKV